MSGGNGRLLGAKGWGAWIALVLATFTIALLPQMVHIAPPPGAVTMSEARFSLVGDATETRIALPYRWTPEAPYDLSTGRYRLRFHLDTVPEEPLFVLIPAARHDIEVKVNGQKTMSALDTSWSTPNSGYSFLALIPEGAVHAGDNEIVLWQTREVGWLPARLSTVSVGAASAVLPIYQLSNFLIDQVRAMTFALHVMLTIGIATIWTARRHDPVFRWLALISITSLMVVFTQSPIMSFGALVQMQSTVAMSAVGLMALGLAQAVAGQSNSRLLLAIVGLPVLLLGLGFAGVLEFTVVGLLSVTVGLLAYVAASVVLLRAFARSRGFDAAFLAAACALTAWFGLHDILVVTGLLDDPFLLTSYARTLMLLVIMVILMGRLARSLNGLDAANDTLRQRLAAREAELVLLHEKERAHTNEVVREHERERLMRDLHDGMSGHLVTIIALAERDPAGGEAIERAARAALDDLRLVVHSLDLGDGDLRVALAAFRERLEPQLRRLGIELSWSTEKLPEVSGVTPSNALAVLRILQEAVTNAVKHGPARRIRVEGATMEGGVAAIHVVNDGSPTSRVGKGNGMGNMERRARDLGGQVHFSTTAEESRLSLTFPAHLSECQFGEQMPRSRSKKGSATVSDDPVL
jgi:two-component system sensor histidine kinase UhpB